MSVKANTNKQDTDLMKSKSKNSFSMEEKNQIVHLSNKSENTNNENARNNNGGKNMHNSYCLRTITRSKIKLPFILYHMHSKMLTIASY